METARNRISRTVLSIGDTRSRLDRVLVVRVTPELTARVDAALQAHPALARTSRSEFARRAMLFALASLGSGETE